LSEPEAAISGMSDYIQCKLESKTAAF